MLGCGEVRVGMERCVGGGEGEVCLGCGKCVGVGGRCRESWKVWGGVENVGEECGSVFGEWGGVGMC